MAKFNEIAFMEKNLAWQKYQIFHKIAITEFEETETARQIWCHQEERK